MAADDRIEVETTTSKLVDDGEGLPEVVDTGKVKMSFPAGEGPST